MIAWDFNHTKEELKKEVPMEGKHNSKSGPWEMLFQTSFLIMTPIKSYPLVESSSFHALPYVTQKTKLRVKADIFLKEWEPLESIVSVLMLQMYLCIYSPGKTRLQQISSRIQRHVMLIGWHLWRQFENSTPNLRAALQHNPNMHWHSQAACIQYRLGASWKSSQGKMIFFSLPHIILSLPYGAT